MDLWTRQKLQKANQTATAAQWFSHFFEKAFVNRVNRRTPMGEREDDISVGGRQQFGASRTWL